MVYENYQGDYYAVPYDRHNREAYHEERRFIENEFKYALQREYLSDAPDSVADRVWELAWQEGHSSGFGDVEHYYQEFAELVRSTHADWN